MNRARVLKFPDPEIRSISVDPVTKEIVIRLAPGSDTLTQIGYVLQSLEEMVRHLRMVQGSAERDIANEDRHEQRKRRYIELAQAYQRLRVAGAQHVQRVCAKFFAGACLAGYENVQVGLRRH